MSSIMVSCYHVPVVGVGPFHGWGERLPASHERIRERRFHLREEAGDVGVGFFMRLPPLALQVA
ncbi:MAG TPA: hypothetical protein VMG38_26360 [Trebonia sp.]|nr:hypothetical protein [Trebonia sp.]